MRLPFFPICIKPSFQNRQGIFCLSLSLGIVVCIYLPSFAESPSQPAATSLAPLSEQATTKQEGSSPIHTKATSETPSPVIIGPQRLVIQAMMRLLVNKGIFPKHVYEQYRQGENPIVNRAHFTDVLLKALGHDTSIYSEFPVYRDVDTTYWAYAPIEVARERKILEGSHNGYFHPDEPITRKDAYLALANTLAGKNPSLEIANSILSPFDDASAVPEAIRPDIARLVNAEIILPQPKPNNQLALNHALRYDELATILSREVEIKDYKRFLLPIDKKTLPLLPGGIVFEVVPNGAIYKNHLAVGDPLYFSLTEDTQTTIDSNTITLPRGTRLDGNLAGIHNQDYIIQLTGLQTPEGKRYQLHGNLTLNFNSKAAEPFVVAGTPYQVTSQP